ncbi:MAG: DUF3486 family protein [Waterburya sp.]
MPQRNSVYYLPDNLKKELDKKLVENHFSGYVELERWLSLEGYEVSKSSIHRYGAKFKKQLENIQLATEQAKIIAQECDDENDMADALARLAQQKLFQVLVDLEDLPENIELPKLVTAIATLNRSSVNVKKYQSEVKAKVKSAQEQVADIGIKSGIPEAVMEEIKKSMLGISS